MSAGAADCQHGRLVLRGSVAADTGRVAVPRRPIHQRDELLAETSVDAASRADSKYEHDESIVADVVDDAEAADANAPPPGDAGNFITVRDHLIADMTEVWTGIDETAPDGTRPG